MAQKLPAKVQIKSPICTILLSKSDFSFALLLVTFEPLDIQQSYIPLLKALMCGINAVGAQGSGCMFTLCHAPLKMAVLLHKTEKVWDSFSETVNPKFPRLVLEVQGLLDLCGFDLCGFDLCGCLNTFRSLIYTVLFLELHGFLKGILNILYFEGKVA